jgi:hypothetical protein
MNRTGGQVGGHLERSVRRWTGTTLAMANGVAGQCGSARSAGGAQVNTFISEQPV